ncbi:MAG: nucleotide-binding protein, partial [Gemmatimonadetes bacterium]|nr:nucleotide-binding protein [Gemmatimonadota bacterium]
YDLVTSSLFLHHLAWPEAVELLRRMAAGARRRLFVQDLRRTRLGYVLAWLGLHTFSRSEVARVDGLRSVEAAFSVDEARRLCAEAALRSAVVGVAWPQRFIMRWDRAEVA